MLPLGKNYRAKAACRLFGTGHMRARIVEFDYQAYGDALYPQQALFGALIAQCRGLCPAEGAMEAGMCKHNTS